MHYNAETKELEKKAWSELPDVPLEVKRFVCISDLHGRFDYFDIPKTGTSKSVLLVAGDISDKTKLATNLETIEQIKMFDKWLGEMNFEHKIVIAGNWDECLLKCTNNLNERKQLFSNCTYLENEVLELFEGRLKLFASPLSHVKARSDNRAFQHVEDSDSFEEVCSKIPNDTDLLLIHGPPYIAKHKHMKVVRGSHHLKKHLMRVKPVVTVCGHLHMKHGVFHIPSEYKEEHLTVFNASMVGVLYAPTRCPIVFDLHIERKDLV